VTGIVTLVPVEPMCRTGGLSSWRSRWRSVRPRSFSQSWTTAERRSSSPCGHRCSWTVFALALWACFVAMPCVDHQTCIVDSHSCQDIPSGSTIPDIMAYDLCSITEHVSLSQLLFNHVPHQVSDVFWGVRAQAVSLTRQRLAKQHGFAPSLSTVIVSTSAPKAGVAVCC
jgi:hypothetical protein